MDYDYSHHIHDVFAYNYLSPMHLEGLPDPGNLCDRLDQVDCKMLLDGSGVFRGVALYLPEDRQARLSTEMALRPMIRRLTDPIVGPVYLLLRSEQVAAVGGAEALGQFEFVKATNILPYGFVKILCHTYEELDYLLIRSSEQRLYEKLYSKGRRRRYVEDMVVYPPLQNGLRGKASNSGIQRFPKLGGGCAENYYDYAKLFYANDIDLRKLDIWFLLGDLPDLKGVAALEATLQKWMSHISAHPHAYGELELLQVPRFVEAGAKKCAHIKADATALKEESLDLLMVMMDEINLDNCKVQFVVLGERDLISEQPSSQTAQRYGPNGGS